jgi:hypothetical protein
MIKNQLDVFQLRNFQTAICSPKFQTFRMQLAYMNIIQEERERERERSHKKYIMHRGQVTQLVLLLPIKSFMFKV